MLQAIDAERDQVGGVAGLQAADVVALQNLCAAQRREFQRLSRRHAICPRLVARPADPLQQHGLPRLTEHVVAVVTRRSIHAERDLDPGIEHGTHRCNARREDHVAARAMADAAAACRHAPDLVLVRMHHVREPDLVTVPVQLLDKFERSLAEFLHAITGLVQGFGEMRVQAHMLVAAREPRTVDHEFGRHTERRAWGKPNAQHRQRGRVMKGFQHAPAVGENVLLVLDQIVGRQTAGAFAHAHAAARRMEAHAELLRGADLVVEPAAVREQIQVIRHGSRSAEHQFTQREFRADVDRIGIDLRPDRIEHLQPVEQAEPAPGADRACQRLKQMVMAVHHSGHNHAAACADGFVGRTSSRIGRHPRYDVCVGADRFDCVATDEHTAAANFAADRIHRHDDVGAMHEQRAHSTSPPNSKPLNHHD